MTKRTIGISEELNTYIQAVAVQETEQLAALRQETLSLAEHTMQISPEQGQFMSLLVNLLNAKHVLEVGVFTGYSTLCMAKELPPEGQVLACDISPEWTQIGQRYWQAAGVADKIELRLAPANQTLARLVEEGYQGHFDLVFIDADKSNYLEYYQQALLLVRKGGLVLVDNTLWGGSVADPNDQSEDTKAIRELNQFIADDQRVKSSLLPVSDGLTLVCKL